MKLFLALLISFSAYAIPEADYQNVWLNQVLPVLDKEPAAEFTNPQGLKVRYRTYLRGAGLPGLVIVPGRQEPMKKYYELIHDLPEFNIFIIDHQGQGESERLLNNTQIGHVRLFQHYVDDFKYWMDSHVLPSSQGQKLYLLAHSMGGAIAVKYAATQPDVFKKIVLSAPMFSIVTDPYPTPIAKLLAKTLMLAGRGAKYAPGRGPYLPEDDVIGKNEFTHSESRLWMNKKLFVDMPELTIGGPSVSWVNQTLKTLSSLYKDGSKLKQPILLLQAEHDVIVKGKKQRQFCDLAISCQLVQVQGAYHEILQEKDSIRDPALELIQQFLK